MTDTVVSSATRQVVIGSGRPFVIIGERINPTGRPKFQEQLRAGNLALLEADVHAQVAGGATMLDVNMGVPLTDEAEMLAAAIIIVLPVVLVFVALQRRFIDGMTAGAVKS